MSDCHDSLAVFLLFTIVNKKNCFLLVGARDVYERAVEFFGEENADEKLFLAFGKFEENCKEVHNYILLMLLPLENRDKANQVVV